MDYLRVHKYFGLAKKYNTGSFLSKVRDAYKNDSTMLETALVNIALLSRDQDQLDDAANLLEESLKHKKTPRILHDLGTIYRRLGNKDKAEKAFVHSIEERGSIADIYLLDTYNQLGLLYQTSFKDKKKAEESFKNAIDIGEKFEEPIKTAYAMNNLSRLYLEESQLSEAKKYAKAAFEIREKAKNGSKGQKIDFANSAYTLGLVYFKEERYDKAKAYFKNAYEIKKEVLPENDKGVQEAWKFFEQSVIESTFKNLNESVKDNGKYNFFDHTTYNYVDDENVQNEDMKKSEFKPTNKN
jgi:tetratricopeptide (TPR) repeat protein